MLSHEQIMDRRQANADAVPRLWARAKIEVTFLTKGGLPVTFGSASPLAVPNGLLLIGKDAGGAPTGYALVGREAGQEVFRFGTELLRAAPPVATPSNPHPPASIPQAISYMWFRAGERAGAWYAEHSATTALAELPFDPLQVFAVFQVCDPLLSATNSFITMERKPCAYRLVRTAHSDQAANYGTVCHYETYLAWSDEAPPRAFMMKFFDTRGRRIVTAHLKDYKPIEVVPEEDPETGEELPLPEVTPEMPTDIELVWEDWPGMEKSSIRRIRLVLSEMTTENKWHPDALKFRDNLPAGVAPRLIHPPRGGLFSPLQEETE